MGPILAMNMPAPLGAVSTAPADLFAELLKARQTILPKCLGALGSDMA